ncbi:MAG: hypothetical protein KKC53_01935 [Actinobacteria bacterium]|nr:hypothetical protein [Actinomycetota bacterium]
MKKSILVIYLVLVLISISIYALFDYILPFINVTLSPIANKLTKCILPVAVGFFISYFIFKLKNPEIKRTNFDFRRFVIFGIVPLISLIIYLTSLHLIISEKIFKNFEVLSISIKYIFDKYDLWGLWLGFALGASFKISKDKKA